MCAYLGCHNVTILDALDLVPVCRIYSGLTRKTVDSNKVSGISVVAARKSCKYFKWSCVCCDVFHCSAPVVVCQDAPWGVSSGNQPDSSVGIVFSRYGCIHQLRSRSTFYVFLLDQPIYR